MNYLEKNLKQRFNKKRFDPSKQSFFALYIWRKLSLPLTFIFSYTFFTANMVTGLSYIFVLFALYFYYILGAMNLLYGSICLFLYSVLDHVDGEIARLKGHSSFRGRLFENHVGVVKDGFIIFILTHNLYNQTDSLNTWYLGFLIMSLTYISSSLLTEVRIENLKSEETQNHISREMGLKFFNIPLNKIYSFFFSGVTRNISILILAGLNQLSILFNMLLLIVAADSLLLLYIVFFRLFK